MKPGDVIVSMHIIRADREKYEADGWTVTEYSHHNLSRHGLRATKVEEKPSWTKPSENS
jgi:hypothetical protein